jgi:hypothetical protein
MIPANIERNGILEHRVQIRRDDGWYCVTGPYGRNGTYIFIFILKNFSKLKRGRTEHVARDRARLKGTVLFGNKWRIIDCLVPPS